MVSGITPSGQTETLFLRGSLVPILVPPLEFSDAEGVLRGTQCFKINDKNNLSSLYDEFTKHARRKRPWLTPSGHGTFEEHRDLFLKELPKKLQKKASRSESPKSAITTPVTKAALPAPHPPPLRSGEAHKEFKRLVSELRAALAKLPMIVRIAFMYDANDTKATEYPEHKKDVNDAEYRGFIKAEEAWEFNAASTGRVFSPTKASQHNRDVYRILKELSDLLSNAPPAFHHEYERQNDHPANLRIFPFWDTHDLLSEGEPGKETAAFRR
ncbi:hypothetical protein [Hyalangium versicolor]|uniref:hypothetical protein n=1 Tax=Hyalangium versicolor TaxID=2861190 RepID=UPI001CC9E607|nr:hypothetical protein [Hyalangium versicolor]